MKVAYMSMKEEQDSLRQHKESLESTNQEREDLCSRLEKQLKIKETEVQR